MKKTMPADKEILRSAFQNRENQFIHHSYNRDMLPYFCLKEGDERAVTLLLENFRSNVTGRLSDNPLRNQKYLFVSSTTLATRFAIEGGVNPEESYNISDVFIRRADRCLSLEELMPLFHEMISYFLEAVRESQLEKQANLSDNEKTTAPVYSRPVIQCLSYIDAHLHEPLRLSSLAAMLSVSASYLSALFKRETGIGISRYIREKKLKAALQLLLHSELSISEISFFLSFCNESHFIQDFKKYTGQTPKQFRKQSYSHFFPSPEDKNSSSVFPDFQTSSAVSPK